MSVKKLEKKWLTDGDPDVMINIICPPAAIGYYLGMPGYKQPDYSRKLRLSTVACARYAWASMPGYYCTDGIEIAERFADGDATHEQRDAAGDHIVNARDHLIYEDEDETSANARWLAAATLRAVPAADMVATNEHALSLVPKAIQAAILRDIFGNPFKPIILNEYETCPTCCGAGVTTGLAMCPTCNGFGRLVHWLTPRVLSLAQACYDDRSPTNGAIDGGQINVLIDAMLDAGYEEYAVCKKCDGSKKVYSGLRPNSDLDDNEYVCTKCGRVTSMMGHYDVSTGQIKCPTTDCVECAGLGRSPTPLMAALRGGPEPALGYHVRGFHPLDVILGM